MSIESQIRRARLRYAASLIRVAQPSVAALPSEGRKAPTSVTMDRYGMRAHYSETLATQALMGNATQSNISVQLA